MELSNGILELKSSTNLLIPPPKKAKIHSSPSEYSSIATDNSESSFAEGNLFTKDTTRRVNKQKDSVEKRVEISHAEDHSEIFPIPLFYQQYLSSPSGLIMGFCRLPKVKEHKSRKILRPVYRLKESDRREVSVSISSESGNDLVSAMEAHEKEFLRYAPLQKRTKLEILHEPCESLSDFEDEDVDFNYNILIESREKGKINVDSSHFSHSSVEGDEKTKKKSPKTFWEFKLSKKTNSTWESSSTKGNLNGGEPSSWNSYFKGKLRKGPKTTNGLDGECTETLAVKPEMKSDLTETSKGANTAEVNLPRTVASYWQFRPVLQKSLRIQEKVMTGNGDTSSQLKKSNTSARRMKQSNKTRHPQPQPASWFQKLLGFLRIRSRPANTNSSRKLQTKLNAQLPKDRSKPQRNVELDSMKVAEVGNPVGKNSGSAIPEEIVRPLKSHKDSKTMLREKRLKLFEEAQEFYEDSVMAYRNSLLNQLTSELPSKVTAYQSRQLPLPTTAFILSSLPNTSKRYPNTAAFAGRLPSMSKGGSVATYCVSETALLPVMKGRQPFEWMNVNTLPMMEAIDENSTKGTVKGILKKPKFP